MNSKREKAGLRSSKLELERKWHAIQKTKEQNLNKARFVSKSFSQNSCYTIFAPFSDFPDHTALNHYLIFDFIQSAGSFPMLLITEITRFFQVRNPESYCTVASCNISNIPQKHGLLLYLLTPRNISLKIIHRDDFTNNRGSEKIFL